MAEPTQPLDTKSAGPCAAPAEHVEVATLDDRDDASLAEAGWANKPSLR